ncbi:MAG: acireductone synthase [Gemmatimonadales bacterium]
MKAVGAVLLDIEGTTTPIDFVHKTLFGYARARVKEFLQRHWSDSEVRADIARLGAERAAEAPQPSLAPWAEDVTGIAAYVHWLMDRDRKSTGLKALQGKIWEEGYGSGELKGEVYPDVAPAMERWRSEGIDIAIFSSGSVQAQRSLFRSSTAGDLTRFILAYFDTTTGPKTAPMSYARIAAALERDPTEVLFVSDVGAELDAALMAGMQTALCMREQGSPPATGAHPVIGTFDEVGG